MKKGTHNPPEVPTSSTSDPVDPVPLNETAQRVVSARLHGGKKAVRSRMAVRKGGGFFLSTDRGSAEWGCDF
ncbi:hypothetical protein [Pseudomonas umsongensis]|jgi:hypothetical protein|uniref:hypothetical protein n=1 Tax=Pseudomonas umsongensis TaxID=198618 RepID=UPI0012DECE27|nr:hypothetical protein [Pseudomonas umsongensis]